MCCVQDHENRQESFAYTKGLVDQSLGFAQDDIRGSVGADESVRPLGEQ
jgi:hypothetical protein